MTEKRTRRAVMEGDLAAAVVPLFQLDTVGSLGRWDTPSGAEFANAIGEQVSAFARLEAPVMLEQNTAGHLFDQVQTGLAFDAVTHTTGAFDEHYGQRFVFHSIHQEFGRFVYVVPDDDARTVINGSKALRASEVRGALVAMAKAHLDHNTASALHVFNSALTYDATVGGDGVSLCSETHPVEGCTWSNLLKGNPPLTSKNLMDALWHVRKNAVDSTGLKIRLSGRFLIVPLGQAEAATAALAGLPENFEEMSRTPIVVPGLAEGSWFIKTNVRGLTRYIRAPFEMMVSIDKAYDAVLVQSYERGSWTYTDPRVLFGSVAPQMKG